MIIQRWVAFALAGAVRRSDRRAGGGTALAAGHTDKPKKAEAAKKCNVAGSPGVLGV